MGRRRGANRQLLRGGRGRRPPRQRSITKTHERISQLGWEPTYHEPAVRYPSRYTFPTKAKDR